MVAEKFELYTEVQLTKSLPELGFIEGDVATIVDIITTPDNHKAYCLEFFDAQGKTIDVALVGETDIQPPIQHAVVNYRQYKK